MSKADSYNHPLFSDDMNWGLDEELRLYYCPFDG